MMGSAGATEGHEGQGEQSERTEVRKGPHRRAAYDIGICSS